MLGKIIGITMVAACTLMVTGAVHAKQPAKEPNLVQVAIELNDAGAFEGEFSTLIMLVANDAGARHVAVAFGVPVVVFMGPTSLEKTNLNLERVGGKREALDRAPVRHLADGLSCHGARSPILPVRLRSSTRAPAHQTVHTGRSLRGLAG